MKILFLVTHTKNNKIFVHEAKKKSIQLDLYHYYELKISFTDNKIKIRVNNHSIDDYDLIHFRHLKKNTELATIISSYCLEKKIPVLDPVFVNKLPWVDRKSFEYTKLAENNLPIIDTLFLSKQPFEKIAEKIQYPCIVKTTDQSQGRGVYLIKDQNSIEKLFDKYHSHLLIQKFIKNDGDYRFFVIGNKVIAAMKRVATSQNEFRNNISLGGKAEIYNPKAVEEKLAIKAARALGYAFAGVDLIKENGQMKILEVNRAPQFTGLMQSTKANIPGKMIDYCVDYAKKFKKK
ncbi:MAG: RimK family alpha-L-glutamate ligase [Candidatus Woesebacteria bacterium]|jgi:RimK family alpha-L-glutamate ligase